MSCLCPKNTIQHVPCITPLQGSPSLPPWTPLCFFLFIRGDCTSTNLVHVFLAAQSPWGSPRLCELQVFICGSAVCSKSTEIPAQCPLSCVSNVMASQPPNSTLTSRARESQNTPGPLQSERGGTKLAGIQ